MTMHGGEAVCHGYHVWEPYGAAIKCARCGLVVPDESSDSGEQR